MTDRPARPRVSTLLYLVPKLYLLQCHTPVTQIKTTDIIIIMDHHVHDHHREHSHDLQVAIKTMKRKYFFKDFFCFLTLSQSFSGGNQDNEAEVPQLE